VEGLHTIGEVVLPPDVREELATGKPARRRKRPTGEDAVSASCQSLLRLQPEQLPELTKKIEE
jgi:hypothetical protein